MSSFVIHNRKLSMRTAALTLEGVGWISEDIPNPVFCVAVVSRELSRSGHTFEIMINEKSGYEIVPCEVGVVHAVQGFNVEGDVGDVYAFFSNEVDCAKACAKAVKTMIEAAIT